VAKELGHFGSWCYWLRVRYNICQFQVTTLIHIVRVDVVLTDDLSRQTQVYLIDKAERILPFEDEDVSEAVSEIMESKGIIVHHGAKLISMKPVNGEVEYEVK